MYKEWYSVAEMSKIVRVAKARIYKLIREGVIDARWFNNRHNISADEIQYFLRRQKDGFV